MHRTIPTWISAVLALALLAATARNTQGSSGAIVGWGADFVRGNDLSSGFVAVAAGGSHHLALKADGSIVAWGDNSLGQMNVPAPNSDFVAVAAGTTHSLGLKADGSIVAWGCGGYPTRNYRQ